MPQSRAVATKQKLIAAAVELFIVRGYLETTPKQIATAADLTTGAFYYHFSSKEELGLAIAEQSWPNVAKVLNVYLDTPQPGLEGVTRAVFAVAASIFTDPLQWTGFFLDHAVGYLSTHARQMHRDRLGAFTSTLHEALIDSEIRSAVSRKQASELLCLAALGALMVSGVLNEGVKAGLDRLEMAWSAALGTIVPAEQIPRWERSVSEIAAGFGKSCGESRLAR